MAPTSNVLASSATPTQRLLSSQDTRALTNVSAVSEGDGEGLQPPRVGGDGRSQSLSNGSFAPRGSSLAPSAPPGSFSSDMRSIMPRSVAHRVDKIGLAGTDYMVDENGTSSEQMMAGLKEKLNREMKIKQGSENLLEALNMKKAKQTKEQRSKVEVELSTSNRKIGLLKTQIAELQNSKDQPSLSNRTSNFFRPNALRPQQSKDTINEDSEPEFDEEEESPTFVLGELLQELEEEGLQADYYVERANSLVELFKRNPNLKYDLAWSIFGLRVQTMLLSGSKEVIAAGYRMTRYAITDKRSLQIIRGLNTDYLVILSLIKEGKASVEREQALKFIRAFLDVKNGIHEVSKAVVRAIASVAEHNEDRLRCICIETLAEILVQDPGLMVSAGAMGPLISIVGDGSYSGSESLVTAFLYLFDTPKRRQYLRSGLELECAFSSFTDSLSMHGYEHRLKANAKVIAAILKSWTGLMTISMYDFMAIRSLIASLNFPAPQIRNIILDLFYDVLRIKSPSWSSSFLAGRRLTTYGRVANLKSDPSMNTSQAKDESKSQRNLVDHFTALLLAVLLNAGMLEAVLRVVGDSSDQVVKRKATLLVSEVLKLASRLLPPPISTKLQMLPGLFSIASDFRSDDRFTASSTVYQIDSVNKTLNRSMSIAGPPLRKSLTVDETQQLTRSVDPANAKTNPTMDESQFRSQLLESQVLNHTNHVKWRWDILQNIVEGPLLNPKRLDEAIKATKFIKRVVGFYRPFKYRFANVENTRPHQRYVKVGCSLIRTLLQNPEGIRYLAENKLLRQVAECLAQFDRMSGITSQAPLFSSTRLVETLSGGYFALLGVLSSDPNGLLMMERWRMINMCYHIVELPDRPDLAILLINSMDYSLDSHFRVILSKALTACPKEIRISATNVLRKYVTIGTSGPTTSKPLDTAEWAIRTLVTQLYDPDVEVCETAVKILEEACNRKDYLEYVVICRPALDHLGEIGAPLLLRFLSTSVGYHYLDDLDYITQEMDDWFLGRNDTYVAIVEAALTKAMEEGSQPRPSSVDGEEHGTHSDVPPHFYRELTRTAEGCQLLRDKGHFQEFVSTIRDHAMENNDAEIILKVKGCLWAVGNVGSMVLGGPFLEESDIVEIMVQIAENSEVMTLRGTAFFVLGLVSRSLHGFEILNEFQWDGPTTIMGESLGFSVPMHLARLFSIAPWEQKVDEEQERASAQALKEARTDDDPVNAKILELIVNLGNTIFTKKAVSDLMHIKAKNPAGFRSSRLFRNVMTILECHHYRLPIRRFIVDLFDKDVMRRVILDEDDDDDNDDVLSESSSSETEAGGSLEHSPRSSSP